MSSPSPARVELRSRASWRTLQFGVVVLAADSSGGGNEVLLQTYFESVPISRRAAAAVVEARNRGLGEIMAEFETGLRTALASRP